MLAQQNTWRLKLIPWNRFSVMLAAGGLDCRQGREGLTREGQSEKEDIKWCLNLLVSYESILRLFLTLFVFSLLFFDWFCFLSFVFCQVFFIHSSFSISFLSFFSFLFFLFVFLDLLHVILPLLSPSLFRPAFPYFLPILSSCASPSPSSPSSSNPSLPLVFVAWISSSFRPPLCIIPSLYIFFSFHFLLFILLLLLLLFILLFLLQYIPLLPFRPSVCASGYWCFCNGSW